MRRRDFLTGVAGTIAGGALLTACDDGMTGADHPGRRRRRPTTDAAKPQPSRPAFPGQPPPGRLYYGASVPYYRSVPGWEEELGVRLALHRSYFDPLETDQLVDQSATDLRRGRLPHVSIKPPGTWQDVASGRLDGWLGRLVEGLAGAGGPVVLTVSHEPENDSGSAGMLAQDFVAMQRRAIRLAAAAAPEVTIAPVLQTWTFEPTRPASAPDSWVVPEASVFGLDVYNPWFPGGGKPWRSFGSKMDEVAPWIGDKAVVIGEYGCRVDPLLPQRTSSWLVDAFAYARTHNIVSMSYFNSGLNSPDGSWELAGQPERTFSRLLRSRWVARP